MSATSKLRNVRLADQCWGDLQAQIASNIAAEMAHRRADRAVGPTRPGRRRGAASTTRASAFTALEQLPDGEVVGEDAMEDDGRGNGPIPIRVRLTKTPEGIVADFAGTAPNQPAADCTFACTRAAVIGAVVAAIDPDLPLNHGITGVHRGPCGARQLRQPCLPGAVLGTTADQRRTMETLNAPHAIALERIPAGAYSTVSGVGG